MLDYQDLFTHLNLKLDDEVSRQLSSQIVQNVVNDKTHLGYTEFICAAVDPEVLLSKRNIDMAFKLLDVNDDQVISVGEMQDMLAINKDSD